MTDSELAKTGDGERKRGGCLTAWLILILVANALVAVFYLITLADGGDLLDAPVWAISVLSILGIFNAVCAVAVLRWKKWGIYGFGFDTIVALIVNLVIGIPIYTALVGLVGIIILIVLVRPVWKYME